MGRIIKRIWALSCHNNESERERKKETEFINAFGTLGVMLQLAKRERERERERENGGRGI
jgi:hypothetical protein